MALVKPPFAGKLSGFTLLFEALVLMLARQMPMAAVARTVGISEHRAWAICRRYVALALEAADAAARRVLSVTEGRDAEAVKAIAEELAEQGCPPERIESVSIDMSPAFIKGCAEHLPNARITFDRVHVLWNANAAVDKMRRIEQRSDKSLKRMRWSLLKDRADLKPEAAANLDALIARGRRVRTARAWAYKEQLREILERKQINVVRAALQHW